MDTELYRAFVAVAEGRGFSQAGRALNRTQSTVSLQIKRLEERLDCQLFSRTSRRVSLTAEGARLLPYARQMLGLEEQLSRALDASRTHEPLRLGITEEQAQAYLPAVLPEFAHRHPQVRVELTCQLSTALIERFEEGLLDVVLNIWHGPTRSGEIIGREPLVWAATAAFEPPQGQPLPLALNPDGCIFRQHALSRLDRAAIPWQLRYTSQSPTGINQPVQSGLAVAVKTPRSLPAGCVDAGERLGLPAMGVVDIEIHRGPAQLSEALDTFCDLLRTAVSRHEDVHAVADGGTL